jgi:uncharacterized membrane protein
MLTLLGFAVLVVGFAVRLNPILVVVAAAMTTGIAAGLGLVEVLEAFGKAFNENRFVSATYMILLLIGTLERAGLQERAKMLIARFRQVSVGALLIGYFVFRQATSAIGLHPIAGQERTVRPLLAPMAEAAVESHVGPVDEATRQAVRAQAAATDNIALFFGEDVFVAIGSILLMVGFVRASGIELDPIELSIWAIPTAIVALAIHTTRLVLFQRRMHRR